MMEEYISKTFNSKRLYGRAREVLPSDVTYIIRHFEFCSFYIKKAKEVDL